MGSSCSFPKCYDNNEIPGTIETESEPKKKDNEIPLDTFLLLIPDQIKKEMESEKDFFENQKNNSSIKTIKIEDENSVNNEEIYYHGEFNDKDEQEGIGKMIIINENKEKTIYHGIWEKNELKKGIIYYNDNSKYKGDIKNLLRHGKGTYTSEAETYEGNWVEDKKEGEGFLTFKDKITYKGSFKNNKFNGEGEMKWPNNIYYKGEFSNNLFHGKGFLKGNNDNTYTGNFSKGVYNGEGEFKWVKGVKTAIYKGNYSWGKKDGKGTLSWDNGNKYYGCWESGLPHGEGIFETRNRKYHGNWRSGFFLQLIESEEKKGSEEENINLTFSTPIEDIEINGPFKFNNNSIHGSNHKNGYNDVLVEVIKQN